MLKDRGTMKWTSLMLPEHVEMLKQLWAEEKNIEKPVLDEQMKEVIVKKVLNAYKRKIPIHVKFHENNCFHMINEKIKWIDKIKGTILFEKGKEIHFRQIVSIS